MTERLLIDEGHLGPKSNQKTYPHPRVIEHEWPTHAASNPEPWEMQQGEPTPSYTRFCLYRDKPADRRSFHTIAKESHRSIERTRDEGIAWKWQERARAWDREIDRRTTEKMASDLVEMRIRHAQIGQLMVSKAVQKLMGDEEEGIIKLDVNTLSPRMIALLIEEGVKIERLSRGEATEKTEISGTSEGRTVEIQPVDYRQVVSVLLTDNEDEDDETEE